MLTIEQAVSILDRSERGRDVARELYAFLTGRAASMDIDGKTAVISLVEEAFINRPGSVVAALDDFNPARHTPAFTTPAQCKANARLILAAPDLLAACQYGAGFLDTRNHPGDDDSDVVEITVTIGWLRECRDALAKAEGQVPS